MTNSRLQGNTIVIQNGDRLFTGRLEMTTADSQSGAEDDGACTDVGDGLTDTNIAALAATGIAGTAIGAFLAVMTMYFRQQARLRRNLAAHCSDTSSTVRSQTRYDTLGSELSRIQSEDSAGSDDTDTSAGLNINNGIEGMALDHACMELDPAVFKQYRV